jgi:uncharacterized protein YwgA
MNPTTFLISLLDASGGAIQGRTLLQKRAYFVTLLTDVQVDLGFDAHFYGPYSSVVDNTVTQLKNLSFVQELSTAYGVDHTGFEMKRYDYKLTPDGQEIVGKLRETSEYKKIKNAINKLATAGNPSYMELSMAAKAFFILKKRKEGMSKKELISEAQKFNWNIPPASLESAVSFLEKLDVLQNS